MKSEISVEEKIWRISVDLKHSHKEWLEIVTYLIKTLEDYLQEPIEVLDQGIEESIVDDEAICCSICSSISLHQRFGIAWQGRLGIDIINSKPVISVSLFLFSHNKRLCVAGHMGSYMEIIYEKIENNQGAWRSLGWLEDIYGEFENITEFSG